MTAKSKTAVPKKRTRRKVAWRPLRLQIFLKVIALSVAAVIALPLVLIPIYAFVPPVSILMLRDLVTGQGYERTWVPLSEVSDRAVHSVMMSEDARHCAHGGVDWVEMRKALDNILEGGRGRGASTITMQTVKNLFLWHDRSYIRKAIELPLAVYADLVWSKRRTVEIYMNIAEWDKGVYGIEAAAQHYFGRSASQLNRRQSALLAVSLPNPIARNPAKPTRTLNRLASTIERRADGAGAFVQCLSAAPKS